MFWLECYSTVNYLMIHGMILIQYIIYIILVLYERSGRMMVQKTNRGGHRPVISIPYVIIITDVAV